MLGGGGAAPDLRVDAEARLRADPDAEDLEALGTGVGRLGAGGREGDDGGGGEQTGEGTAHGELVEGEGLRADVLDAGARQPAGERVPVEARVARVRGRRRE